MDVDVEVLDVDVDVEVLVEIDVLEDDTDAHTLKPAENTLKSLLHTNSDPCVSRTSCGARPAAYRTPATVK